jgi:hypothetical protein
MWLATLSKEAACMICPDCFCHYFGINLAQLKDSLLNLNCKQDSSISQKNRRFTDEQKAEAVRI